MDAIRVAKASRQMMGMKFMATYSDFFLLLYQVEGVLLDKYGKRSEGVLHVTPHHLIFTTSAGEEWVSPARVIKSNYSTLTDRTHHKRFLIPILPYYIDSLKHTRAYRPYTYAPGCSKRSSYPSNGKGMLRIYGSVLKIFV